MKNNIFTLTKPEQRVVIVIIMALVVAAFIRYWRGTSDRKALNQKWPTNTAVTPFASPSKMPLDADDEVDPATSRPSHHFSP